MALPEYLDETSFAYRDITGVDRWESFTPVFTSLATSGATSYLGRFRLMGRECRFQVEFSAGSGIAATAGTSYLALPVASKGIAGNAAMSDVTTKTAVGVCHVDTATSRCYLPTQGTSTSTFAVSGSYEV